MRIQETNQILKEGKIHRLDHERQEHQHSGLSGLRARWSELAGMASRLSRRTDVQAGLSAAGIALVATAGVLLKSAQQKKRHPWFSFGR